MTKGYGGERDVISAGQRGTLGSQLKTEWQRKAAQTKCGPEAGTSEPLPVTNPFSQEVTSMGNNAASSLPPATCQVSSPHTDGGAI